LSAAATSLCCLSALHAPPTGHRPSVAPRSSVVVPNLNGRRFLRPCLDALAAQTDSDLEVIVVDNGSDDDSVAFVRERFPHARLVELGRNHGFAGAVNAGIAAARGELVAFLNNDAEPAPAWLYELRRCLERHPSAAAATAKLVTSHAPDLLDGAGDGLTPSFLPFVHGHGKDDADQYNEEIQVFGASGTASLWRGDVLQRLGGFDERFFAYYEDVDLSFRARLLGHEIWYAPRAVAVHRRGGTAGTDLRFTLYHPAKNRWFFLLKDAPAGLLVRHPLGLVVGEGFWWMRALRSRSPIILLRAYAEVARNLRPLLRERRKLQSSRVVSAGELDRLLGHQG
jgi:GT2 family glycosyltransferase